MRAVEAIIAEFFRSVRVTIDREARISADRDAVDPGPAPGRASRRVRISAAKFGKYFFEKLPR
jgi:hypothetical protein